MIGRSAMSRTVPSPTAAPPAAPTAADAAATGGVFDLLLRTAVIVLAVLWIYAPTYHGEWLWDDDMLLTANETVQSGSLRGLAKLWFNPDGADFFPLSYTALWAQWPFFGPNSTGYHVTTILLHITGSLLIWRLLDRMRVPGAWLSSLIFAIHPVSVESVAWVSETKNTLSLPLFLLSCLCWIEQDEENGASRRGRMYLLSILFFALAMFAKTSMVAMPVLILLYAWWKRGAVTERDLLLSAPFFAISLVLGLITIRYQHGRAIGSETIIVGGMDSRIATAGMAILFYLKQIVWPVNLLPIYPRWEVDPPKLWQFLAWPVLLAGVAWLWVNRGTAQEPRWGRHVLFGLGFFLLMVLPVLGFVTIAYMRITWVADHFIYLPMVGVIPLIGATFVQQFQRSDARSRRVFLAGGGIVLSTFALLSFLYANAWASEESLWSYTLRINENAWQAHNRLGAKVFARGDIPTAFHHFTRSTQLRPDLGETHNNLGTALNALGRYDEAIEQFQIANRCTPNVPAMQLNLANALFGKQRYAEAAEAFRTILKTTSPGNPAMYNNLAVALYRAGNREESIRSFRKALEIQPNLKDAQEGLAIALGEKPDPLAGDAPPTAGAPAASGSTQAAPAQSPAPGRATLNAPPAAQPFDLLSPLQPK